MILSIFFKSGRHVNTTLVLNACTSWIENMRVTILSNHTR